MTTRLTTELRLLYAVERDYQLAATLVIRQLATWEDARLPDALPPSPPWTTFQWPMSGAVNFDDYWRARDRGQGRGQWMGPYL